MVTAWNSSRRPGARRQSTVEAGRRESLGGHGSGRGRRVAPGPRTFCLRARAGQGSGAAQRIPLGWPGSGRGRAGGSRPGRTSAAALGAGWGPRPCPRPSPRMDRSRSLRRAGPPRSPPAARSPPARRLLQSRRRSQSQRRTQPTRPGASAWQGKARQGRSDKGNEPMGSLQAEGASRGHVLGLVARWAPPRSLEGSAGASWHCGEGCGVGAGTAGHRDLADRCCREPPSKDSRDYRPPTQFYLVGRGAVGMLIITAFSL